MTDRSEESKHIKCSKCWCNYINDGEHIKQDFGYNRLEERFKTCVKCRKRRGRQFNKEIDDHHQYCTRCYKIKPKIGYGEYSHRTMGQSYILRTNHVNSEEIETNGEW